MTRKEVSPQTALGQRIRQLRKAQKLTQEQVARRGDLRIRTFTDVERGDAYDPHYSTLRAIAHGLDVGLVELLGNLDEPTGAPK